MHSYSTLTNWEYYIAELLRTSRLFLIMDVFDLFFTESNMHFNKKSED